ncbi:hypothetical protein ABTL75_20585, partial [Acinetobacter baumannii]
NWWYEAGYLAPNPDVAAAVTAARLPSGLWHAAYFGVREGRAGIVGWNETGYLQVNPDVAAAVNQGVQSSGLLHAMLFGVREGRAGISGWN